MIGSVANTGIGWQVRLHHGKSYKVRASPFTRGKVADGRASVLASLSSFRLDGLFSWETVPFPPINSKIMNHLAERLKIHGLYKVSVSVICIGSLLIPI